MASQHDGSSKTTTEVGPVMKNPDDVSKAIDTPDSTAGPDEVTSAPSAAEAESSTDMKTTPTAASDSGSPPTESIEPTAEQGPIASSPTPWQAIFSPQHNAYYFYNTETQQTTWENPLLPSASSSSNVTQPDDMEGTPEDPTSFPGGSSNPYTALQTAAAAAGIDPSLAHLDPSLLSSLPSSSNGVAISGMPPTFSAKFNARTGQFTRPDARDPSHLSEHARAARMSEFYFDVNAWEQQLEEQGGSVHGPEEGRKRKRPSKKDLERFKEQKRLKKIAKTAWLRT